MGRIFGSKFNESNIRQNHSVQFHAIDRFVHRLSINRPTKRGKENSRSDGHCQFEKEMEEHLLACQQIFEITPLINPIW
jgi:hypothetical protein